MKQYTFKFLMFVITAAAFFSCKKLPDGFLSPSVRYEETPILINSGRVYVSSALNMDGSSAPASVKLLHVYDSAGNNVDAIFTKQYTIKGWSALYNPNTDTTLALIQAKQIDIPVTPIDINERSGQVEANYTTKYIPPGLYSFDLQISNGAGTRTYPKIGQMKLLPAKAYDGSPELGTPLNVAILVGNESSTHSQPSPLETIEWVADTPNVVLLKIVDKNGIPFNPKTEILRRPNAGLNPVPALRPNLQAKGLGTTYTDSTVNVVYGFNPFPLFADPNGYGYRYYYRVPTQFIHIDGLPDDTYSTNPSFVARFFFPGKYFVTVTIPDVTHR